MGFFSWNCRGCGESIKSPYSCEHKSWQNDCVVMLKNGTRVVGEYDGYGRVSGFDAADEDELEFWHKRCWDKAGNPFFTKASDGANDQGYFYDCAECNAYCEKYPHRMSQTHIGHELECKRTERAVLMKQHPEWADSLEGPVGTRWYCEEGDCPHNGDDDNTCNYAGDSESPLKEEDYDAENVVR